MPSLPQAANKIGLQSIAIILHLVLGRLQYQHLTDSVTLIPNLFFRILTTFMEKNLVMNTTQNAKKLIRQLINNQRFEHSPHAFRAGHVGMHDFNRLAPLLRGLPKKELHKWLDLIDEMAATHSFCNSCYGKIIAYCIIMTKNVPDFELRHEGYKMLYTDCIAATRHNEPRDYMREVLDSMYHGKDHAQRQKHVRYWHEIAEVMSTTGHAA